MNQRASNLPMSVYRDEAGAVVVAGPYDGRPSISFTEWRRVNPSPAFSDVMLNVAGMPIEQGIVERLTRSLQYLGAENLSRLNTILNNACEVINPRQFIRDALRGDDNLPLCIALGKEELLDQSGFMKPEIEYLFLNQKFPDFFRQKVIRNGANQRSFICTSWATEIFEATNAGRKNIRPEDCSPWAVLATASLVGPKDDGKPVSLLGLYL